jgi:hypothetical protein
MAYSRENLQRIGPANRAAPSLFTFVDSGSTLAAIDTSGYMNDAADILLPGDFIFAKASNGFGIFVVDTNTRDLTANPPVAGVVDLKNATAVGTIDSD